MRQHWINPSEITNKKNEASVDFFELENVIIKSNGLNPIMMEEKWKRYL